MLLPQPSISDARFLLLSCHQAALTGVSLLGVYHNKPSPTADSDNLLQFQEISHLSIYPTALFNLATLSLVIVGKIWISSRCVVRGG